MTLGAIILAGGAARRLGGVAKPLVRIGGVSLLERAVAAAEAVGSAPIVVAGPPVPQLEHVRFVREDPAGGGPTAAIAAALPLVDTDQVLVLAADMPYVQRVVPLLVAAVAGDGVHTLDESGRAQWLCGIYRSTALRDAAATLPTTSGAPVRALLAGLHLTGIAVPPGLTADVDTWADVAAARRDVTASRMEPAMNTPSSRTLPPEALDEWAAALRVELGLSAEQLPIAAILDLARDVAVGVARPAAPFSAFAAGLAAGSAGGDPAAIAAALARVTALAEQWANDEARS